MSLDEQSPHYDTGGIEALRVLEAKLTRVQYLGFLLGNCIKYALRLNFKGSAIRDAEKMAFYAQAFLDTLREQPDDAEE